MARKYVTKVRHRLERGKVLSHLPPEQRDLIVRIRADKLTYLSEKKLASLAALARSIEESALPGAFVEAGCALGGSTILLASLKRQERPMLVYDVFGMIPPPTNEDTEEVHERYRAIVEGKSKGIGGDPYYGYMDDLYSVVRSNLDRFSIHPESESIDLIKGLVQDTMQIDAPVALAHVDVDWYEPVLTCLERIFPHLVVGGSIVLDDYFDWGGCRKATDEFLRRIEGQVATDGSAGALRITRLGY